MNKVRLIYAILLSVCVGGTLIVLGVGRKSKMKIQSEAFGYGEFIPKQYTCDAKAGIALNESPPITISGISKRAKSLVIILENPSTEIGMWVHWLVFNIPASPVVNLAGGQDMQSIGAIVGKNTENLNTYAGPCPGIEPRSYYFYVYALDTMLDLDKNADVQQVRAAMEGHIIAKDDLLGKYKRARPVGILS